MVAETDDKEERTEETDENPPVNNTLIGWLAGAVYAEIRAIRCELSEREEHHPGHSVECDEIETDDRLIWLGIGVVFLLSVSGLVLGLISLLT